MSIAENLRFFATLRGIPKATFQESKAELLELTGLAPFEDRMAGQLSGGMKQKLAVVCALLHRPRLLILDEPTNGVDVAARHELWDLLIHRPDTFVIISTNYVEEAGLCDELIYLFYGRLMARGTPESILKNYTKRSTEYRVYGKDLGTLAEALSREPWVRWSRFLGNAIELNVEELSEEEVDRRIRALPAAIERVSLVESRRPDMSAALHALTREGMSLESQHAE
jgi:ABC-2 type transport system ATP-binding protein